MADETGRPGAWLGLAVVPLLPFLGGLLALQALFGADLREIALAPEATYLPETERTMVQLGSVLAYTALSYFHVIVCLLAIVFFLWRLIALPPAARRRGWTLLLVQGVIAVAVSVIISIWQDDIALIWLAYLNTCNLLHLADAEMAIEVTCTGEITALSWLSWVPTFLGMAAVVFAAAWANAGGAGDLPPDEPAWREAFARRVKDLQRGFYAMSAVLVTATLGIMLFLSLPGGLAGGDNKAYNAAVSGYAQGMTAFWGAIFTLTLLVTFVPAALRLWGAARRHESRLDAPAEFHAWVQEHVTLSTRRQLTNLAAALGPIMIGPLGALLGKLVGLG